jgi:hypothetical protein
MSKDKLENEINSSHLLLLTRYDNIKGYYPVKIFEYFSSLKPSLLCPSDHDVMEEFVLKSKSGYITNTIKETVILLSYLMDNPSKIISHKNFNIEYGEQFSRSFQTKKLADFIKSL